MYNGFNDILTQIKSTMFEQFVIPVLRILVPIVAIGLIVWLGIRLVQWLKYRESSYRAITHKQFREVYSDKQMAEQLGSFGEYLIEDKLKKLEGYHRFLFNCYLPKDNGETTEIDAILLHPSGIYVFESKNFSGWIFGKETDRYWTQTLPAGKRKSHKERFFNPIMQNAGHIKWLRQYLSDLPELPIYSYILFSDRCELKNITMTSREHHIIHRGKVLSAVSYHAAREGARLDQATIDAIYDRLYPLTQTSEEVRAAHVQTVQQRKQPVEQTVQPPPAVPEPVRNVSPALQVLCPRCGAPLVLRVAKKGAHNGEQFYGCSSFPQCRYTRKIEE